MQQLGIDARLNSDKNVELLWHCFRRDKTNHSDRPTSVYNTVLYLCDEISL